MKDCLYDVVNAIRISRNSFRRIKINFMWAFLYNLLLIPIAMGVLFPLNQFKLDPMLAGAAMALSSISVVISSLMLKCFRPVYSLSKHLAEEQRKHKVEDLDTSGVTQASESPANGGYKIEDI